MKSQSQATKNKSYQAARTQVIKRCLVTISAFVFIASCSKSTSSASGNPVDCSGSAKTFSADVKPITQASCGGCHGAGSNNGPGALISYSQIFNARTSIRSAVLSGAMPKNGTLTSDEKNSIICWIDKGAPDN